MRKITWLLVKVCRGHITAPGPLWDQNRRVLIANLNMTVRVHEAFLAQYRCAERPCSFAPATGYSTYAHSLMLTLFASMTPAPIAQVHAC